MKAASYHDDLHRNAIANSSPRGLQIEIATLEDVIRSKQQDCRRRAKDLATLPQLRAALERQRGAADA